MGSRTTSRRTITPPPIPVRAESADQDEGLAHGVNPLALRHTINRLNDLASERLANFLALRRVHSQQSTDALAPAPKMLRDPLRSCPGENAEPNRKREGREECGKDKNRDENGCVTMLAEPLDAGNVPDGRAGQVVQQHDDGAAAAVTEMDLAVRGLDAALAAEDFPAGEALVADPAGPCRVDGDSLAGSYFLYAPPDRFKR